MKKLDLKFRFDSIKLLLHKYNLKMCHSNLNSI